MEAHEGTDWLYNRYFLNEANLQKKNFNSSDVIKMHKIVQQTYWSARKSDLSNFVFFKQF